MFTPKESAFLDTQRLARLATVAADGQPDADVVGFQFDGHRFLVGGRNLEATRKFKNVMAGNDRVSLVIDELISVNPWRPRGIKVHGRAVIEDATGHLGNGTYLAIRPTLSWSWGIEPTPRGNPFARNRTVWSER